MIIDIIPTLKDINARKIYGKTVIVLDVFRCTSTIVTALAHGCREVIPVPSQDDALALASSRPKNSYLLSGEYHGKKIGDFDLGNSPFEFSEEVVRDKTIIMSTTNGTSTIRCCKPAKNVLIGSFLNMHAVSSMSAAYLKDITIACAGRRGGIALEDIMAAGCLVHCIKTINSDYHVSDMARTFCYLYKYYKDQLKQVLSSSGSGVNLQNLGYARDIDYCLTLNKHCCIPVYKNNSIKINQALLAE